MECMICSNIKEYNKLLKCGNNGCENVICSCCYLKWIKYNNVDISDHCVFCNKPIDYVIIKQFFNKNDIKMICLRDEDIGCNLSYDDYYLIANTIDKKHKYYGSYGELINQFNSNNGLIDDINKLVYEIRNGNNKFNVNDAKDQIISNKKLLLKKSFEILT